MTTLHTAVFTKDGREFILPGLAYLMESDDPEPGDPISVVWKAMLLSSILQAKLDWRTYETIGDSWTVDMPTVVGQLLSRHFEHGAVRAWFLSGPEFDELASNAGSPI